MNTYVKGFKNAYLFQNGNLQKGDLVVDRGKITNIFYEGIPKDVNGELDEVIQCKDAYLLPGFIDPHVHLRGFEHDYKETPETGTKAALVGGVTTLLAMPNTIPTLSSVDTITRYLETYPKIYTNTGIIAGLGPEMDKAQIEECAKFGVFGLKIYPGMENDYFSLPWPTYNYDTKKAPSISEDEKKVWFSLFENAYIHNLPILFHPQIPINREDAIAEFNRHRLENMNRKNPNLVSHSYEFPEVNEYLFGEFLDSLFTSAQKDNVKIPNIHVCHISTPLLADKLRSIPTSLVNLILETTPHHMLLNYEDNFVNQSYGKVLCPLRSPETMMLIFDRAAEGKFDVIGTDHAPHSIQQKNRLFPATPSGFPGVELLAPLMMTEVLAKRFFLSQVVYNCSTNVANVFGIKNKGKIEVGYDADFILIEKVDPYEVKNEDLITQSKNGPYEGKKLTAKVVKTVLGGEIVYDSVNGFAEPKGKYIKRNV